MYARRRRINVLYHSYLPFLYSASLMSSIAKRNKNMPRAVSYILLYSLSPPFSLSFSLSLTLNFLSLSLLDNTSFLADSLTREISSQKSAFRVASFGYTRIRSRARARVPHTHTSFSFSRLSLTLSYSLSKEANYQRGDDDDEDDEHRRRRSAAPRRPDDKARLR